MKVDFLITGQGIAGTLLSFRLMQAGKTVVVLDDGSGGKASRVAGAVINPWSGKNRGPAPDADLFIPAALDCYRELESLLGQSFIRQLPLYIFPAGTPEDSPQLQAAAEEKGLEHYFSMPAAASGLDEVWLVDAAALLDAWKNYLIKRASYLQETFNPGDCRILPDRVVYKDITAGKIIFCEGAAGALNPLLASLPFTRNRGEALLLHIPDLPADAIYHHTLRLVPRSDGLFWCGSNYRWDFTNLDPDKNWREQAIAALEQWLKIPFKIEDHIVAERPTTAGQIPLVGLHPKYPAVALLNGLGTRGFSSGPFWAAELAQKLVDPAYKIRNYKEEWLNKKFG